MRLKLDKLSSDCVIALVIGICAITNPAAAQQRWSTYINPRFGTTADYPSDMFNIRDPAPVNGDGQGFRTADGRAQLSIYGARNVQNDKPADYVKKYVDPQGIAYKRTASRFYIVSRTRNSEIFYERCNFRPHVNSIIDCINVTYPAREKVSWDSVVVRISRSLRSGVGIELR